MEHDFQRAINMNLFLYIFKQLSGLKIKFSKSSFIFLRRKKMRSNNIGKVLVVKLVPSRFGILEFLSITENFVVLNGMRALMITSSAAGKASCSHKKIDLL
jgi:hypothetical protein